MLFKCLSHKTLMKQIIGHINKCMFNLEVNYSSKYRRQNDLFCADKHINCHTSTYLLEKTIIFSAYNLLMRMLVSLDICL